MATYSIDGLTFDAAMSIPGNEYFECNYWDYGGWVNFICNLTFLFCLIPYSRGIEETGRKNAYVAPFFGLSMSYFANGLWMYISQAH